MELKAQRPICIGTILHGEKPSVCVGCPLQVYAVDVTDELGGPSAIPVADSDLLTDVQDMYYASQNPHDTKRYFAKEVMREVTEAVMRRLEKAKGKTVECSQYRRLVPKNL